jgi:hypothetical protein
MLLPETEDDARALINSLVTQRAKARIDLAEARRRESGFGKMIDGLILMFPSLTHPDEEAI